MAAPPDWLGSLWSALEDQRGGMIPLLSAWGLPTVNSGEDLDRVKEGLLGCSIGRGLCCYGGGGRRAPPRCRCGLPRSSRSSSSSGSPEPARYRQPLRLGSPSFLRRLRVQHRCAAAFPSSFLSLLPFRAKNDVFFSSRWVPLDRAFVFHVVDGRVLRFRRLGANRHRHAKAAMVLLAGVP